MILLYFILKYLQKSTSKWCYNQLRLLKFTEWKSEWLEICCNFRNCEYLVKHLTAACVFGIFPLCIANPQHTYYIFPVCLSCCLSKQCYQSSSTSMLQKALSLPLIWAESETKFELQMLCWSCSYRVATVDVRLRIFNQNQLSVNDLEHFTF